jgi:hypothetical protein
VLDTFLAATYRAADVASRLNLKPNADGYAPPTLERKEWRPDAPAAVRYGESFYSRVLNQYS